MSETPISPRNADNDIGGLINTVSHIIRQKFNRQYESHNITYPQSLVMSYLYTNQDKQMVNQRDLEYALGIKASSVSSLVRNLEAKGFLTCQRTASDARNKSLRLTDSGFAIYSVIYSSVGALESQLADGLSEAEQAELMRMLTHIKSNLAHSEGEPIEYEGSHEFL